MKRLSSIYCLTAIAAVAIALAFFSAEAFSQDARLNLILDDGTVLIYKAEQAGYVEGQKLNVIRGGEVVGTVVVSKMSSTHAQAQIISGANAIKEYDVVMPAAQETGRPSRLSVATTSTAPTERTEVAAARMPDESEYESSPSARRDSRRDSSRDSETAIAMANAAQAESQAAAPPVQATPVQATPVQPTPVQPTPVQQIPAAAIVSRKSSYAFHAGYLFFNESIPGAVTSSSDPALLLGLDYWRPTKAFRSVVYNLSYSRPETVNVFESWQTRSKYEILQLSVSYVWSAFDSKQYGSTGLYWGVGAGYTHASAQTYCEGMCDGVRPTVEDSINGVGYQGLLGYRFSKNYELKLDYRFDKDYFAVTFGLGGKRKRVAVAVEAPPEPEVAVEPEPEPVAIEEPEPEPEPVVEKDVWTYSEYEKPEPIVIIVSEPEVEKTVYYYATQPEIEKKIIVIALEDVFFDFDKSELTPAARTILKRNIQTLRENPRIRIRIAGYTSASGSDDYNQKLSERRAKAVKDFLVQEGLISSDRLVTIGFGESDPATYEAAPKDLYSKAAKSNMRVLFEIIVK